MFAMTFINDDVIFTLLISYHFKYLQEKNQNKLRQTQSRRTVTMSPRRFKSFSTVRRFRLLCKNAVNENVVNMS